jgi:2-polyprenyl-3-methyl-5-hydroxy-6-metoxy-1,4-benzoquinol methylase
MAKPAAHPTPLVQTITTAEIKDEMWLEVSRYQGAGQRQAGPLSLSYPSLNEPLTLPALLALDGASFVDAAYRTILDRSPDDAGMAHLMQELTSGVSKVLLLGQLQRSREGRQLARKLPGLRRRYLVQRLYRLPLLGLIVRLVAAALRRGGVSTVLSGTWRTAPKRQGAALGKLGAAQEAFERRARQQDAAIEALSRRIATMQAHQNQVLGGEAVPVPLNELVGRLTDQEAANQRIRDMIASQGRTLTALVAQNLATGRRLSGLEDSSIESLLAMNDTLEQQAVVLARLEAALSGGPVEASATVGSRVLHETLDERLSRAEAVVAQNRQEVMDQERRIGLLLEAIRGGAQPMPKALRVEDEHAVDKLYVDFEDRFRGTRADIKQRQRFYLPILAEAGAGAPERPIVDVGCGRGEFLELLRDEGLTARGVDMNDAMAASCRDMGLDCTAEDALAYLARQPAGSVGAVTGFHIIEHLPFKTMVRLFDAAHLALAPGGLIVFETPNPANLLVASRWFYLDPTHRNPLPGEMVAMIAEARGFIRVSIVELHPMDQRFGGEDKILSEQLDQIFHGPQDYALLARKP